MTAQSLHAIAAAAVLAAVGCTSAPVDEEPPPAPAPADDDDTPMGTATVSGWVIDESGLAIEDLSVTLCGELCLIDRTDADGLFVFEEVREGVKVLEPATVPIGDDFAVSVRSLTRFFDFVDVQDGEVHILEEAFIVRSVAGAVGPLLGEQQLDLLPELRVSFDADAVLDDGPLPAGAEAVWLGATAVPQSHWPTAGLDGWTVLAAWSLAIWDLEAPDAFAVTATLPNPLDPSTEVAFLVADYTYGFTEGRFFEEPAVLKADGGTLRTPEDAGLDRSTLWLAVANTP